MAEGGGALCLLCLAAGSGLPLFCRSRGGSPRPQLPFSVIGSLNGVHMFGATAGVGLRGAATPSTRLAWGGYGQSITLIVLSSAPGPALAPLLDAAFGAMVLVLGLDELVPIRNVERLKRDLRERLRRFAAAAQTGLGCLVGAGRALLATPPWAGLPPLDSALLAGLLGGAWGAPPARDLPVYLPHSSPTVPHRLLLLELVPGVGVALLCGPRPSLQHLRTQLVPQFWGPVLEQLRGCARPSPPPLPPGVLAFLLVPRPQGRPQSGVGTGRAQAGQLPPERRGAALRQLYALLGPRYCPEGGPDAAPPAPPPPALCYAALPTHAGCALLRPDLLLLLLLPPRAARARLPALARRLLRALRPHAGPTRDPRGTPPDPAGDPENA